VYGVPDWNRPVHETRTALKKLYCSVYWIWCRQSPLARAHCGSNGFPTVLLNPLACDRTSCQVYVTFQTHFVLNVVGLSESWNCLLVEVRSVRSCVT
jgi:hypothetical protein